MSTPADVPDEIDAIFKRYKEYRATRPETEKLCTWIINMSDVPGFNYKQLCTAGYGYTLRDYNRLKKAVQRIKKKLQPSAATTLKKLEAGDFAKFIEDLWKEAKSIATGTVMKWAERAKEIGYFDEKEGKVRMKDFIEDACNFYLEKKELLDTIEERLKDLEATCAMFAELSKPQVLRILALRSYMEFMSQITFLAARGIPVPESIIIEVKDTVNTIIAGTYRPLKEAVPNVG